MKKISLALALTLSLTLSLSASTLTTGASLAKSGMGIVIKSVSKSLTSTGAGVSSTSDTTSGKKEDDPYVLDLDFINAPNLYSKTSIKTKIKYAESLSLDEKKWVSSIINNIPFPYHKGNLLIKKGDHPILERRNDLSGIIGNTLFISEKVFKNQLEKDLNISLARSCWNTIGEKNQIKYSEICGWKSHSFIPVLNVNSLKPGSTPYTSPEDDFVFNLIQPKKNHHWSSRSNFLAQVKGETTQSVDPKLKDYKFSFCFVEDQGFAGASQGHCALVLETPEGKKISFSYTADFNFERPFFSASKALVGNLPRSIRCIDYKELVQIYKSEQRETILTALPLTIEQKNNLLFRIRECFEYEEGRYSFLRQNCANPLRDILLYTYTDNKELKGWKTPLTLWNWSKAISENKS
jgi:hypothetical protein